MPCPRQFGRWLWGVTGIECISLSRLANASGPATSFAKSLLEIAPKALTGSGEFRTAGKPLRARVKEFKVLTGPSNSRQCRFRRGLTEAPAFMNTRQVSLTPRGCFHSRQLTAWRDFSIGSANA